MKRIILMLTVSAMVIFVHSCKDDTPPASKTDLITASGWVMVSATVDPAIDLFGIKINDFFAQMDACDKDDIQIFMSNKTGTMDEGATKCDANDPQTESFTWSFNADETKITIDGDEATLEELTATTLKISSVVNGEDFEEEPPVDHKIVFTYKHK